MIIEFAVKNFRSIRDRESISFLASGKVKEHQRNVIKYNRMSLIKAAAIYGRNASGKTNFLKALTALDYLVGNSSDFKLGEKIPPYEPFKLDAVSPTQPVELYIDFVAPDGLRYIYEIGYTQTEIVNEVLRFFPKTQPTKLFSRKKGKKISFGSSLKGDKKGIERQLLENQLFLSKGANSNIEQFKAPYLFFKTYLFTSVVHDTGYDDYLLGKFSEMIAENKNPMFSRNISRLIRVADTGIDSIQVDEVPEDKLGLQKDMPAELKKQILTRYKYQIKTTHKIKAQNRESESIFFNLREESTGTIKLMAVGGLIIDALGDGSVLVVDELDKSLHPLLTKVLIHLFHNPQVNKKNAQLLFATHDTSLLNNLEFRRDQIWFAEKEEDSSTKMYSLSDIRGVRRELPFDKWYVSGRFGAIPSINEAELAFDFVDDLEENAK